MVAQIAVDVLYFSTGRALAAAGGALGLVGVVVGGLALARPNGRLGSGPVGAVVALVSGLVGMALGAVVAITADSGIGTGNGRGGSYVALVVGLVAVALGYRALSRSRRSNRLNA